MSRPATLAEAVERIIEGEPRDKALGEFLDTFYVAAGPGEQAGMLAEEPRPTADERLDALVAAIAEYLGKRYRVDYLPSWLSGPGRCLAEPWFASPVESDGMREFLTFSTPAEFMHHNIFCESMPLRRASQRSKGEP